MAALKSAKPHGRLSSNPYPTKRLEPELEREMRQISKATHLSVADIKRFSARVGLPIVRQRLLGLTGSEEAKAA